ncbi:hypothetical protein CHS0354_021862 [Potamilus streckersoni]|uniref:Uncharacterized protein n=1 Tax=Potamilus streckersoni TaxID=2493646 RepID=A0AAE0SFM9_9BIVA|nr:hypothetical protein CHS0354_021862 [Potamilus streckersoni]
MHETHERNLFIMEDSDQFLHNDSFTLQYLSKSRKRKRRLKKQAGNFHSNPLPSMSEEAKCVLKQLLEEMKTNKNSVDMPSREADGGSIQWSQESHIRKAIEDSTATNGHLRRDSHSNGSYSFFTSSVSKNGSQHITAVSTCEISDLAQFWEMETHRANNGHTNIPKLPLIGEEEQNTSRQLPVAPVDNGVLPHNGLFEQLPLMEKTFVITPIGFDSRYETPLDYRDLELPPVEITKQAHEKCSQWLNKYT